MNSDEWWEEASAAFYVLGLGKKREMGTGCFFRLFLATIIVKGTGTV